MQTNPAVEQNKNPWNQSGRKGKGLWRNDLLKSQVLSSEWKTERVREDASGDREDGEEEDDELPCVIGGRGRASPNFLPKLTHLTFSLFELRNIARPSQQQLSSCLDWPTLYKPTLYLFDVSEWLDDSAFWQWGPIINYLTLFSALFAPSLPVTKCHTKLPPTCHTCPTPPPPKKLGFLITTTCIIIMWLMVTSRIK